MAYVLNYHQLTPEFFRNLEYLAITKIFLSLYSPLIPNLTWMLFITIWSWLIDENPENSFSKILPIPLFALCIFGGVDKIYMGTWCLHLGYVFWLILVYARDATVWIFRLSSQWRQYTTDSQRSFIVYFPTPMALNCNR